MTVEVTETGADQLRKAIEAMSRYTRKSPVEVIRDQFRLLMARNVVPQTPPTTQFAGERTVKRDVQRSIHVMRARDFESKSMRRLLRERNYPELERIFRRASSVTKLGQAELGQFDPEWHESQRGRRGNVRSHYAYKYATADEQQVRDHITRKQANVGKAKGGWAAAILALGGKVAPWILRHVGQGEFIDQLETSGYIRQINKSPWADGNSDESTIDRSVLSRSRAIHKDIALRIERDKKKAGL